jgi:hypothetical protein
MSSGKLGRDFVSGMKSARKFGHEIGHANFLWIWELGTNIRVGLFEERPCRDR